MKVYPMGECLGGGGNEIAISASIVNRMVKNIQDIIGKKCYLSI